MTTTILPERLERLLSDDVHLRAGAGTGVGETFDACATQIAGWLVGGDGKSDSPRCVSAKIAYYVIRLNDSLLFAEHRDLLKPYCAKIVGTAGASGEREVKRAYVFADYAVRVFAPIWLRSDPKHRFDEQAAKLESLSPIVDETTRKVAWKAANEARADAADAAYGAYGAASATYAAYATAAAADAAYGAYGAASATYAAYAAAAAADAKHGDLLRAKALECLDAVLEIA